MASVTSVPVPFKMWCMFFYTVRLVCVLFQSKLWSNCLFSFLSASLFLLRPLTFCMPCLVRLSLVSFLNGKTNSVISSRTLWTTFWLAKNSNKPISLTTRLAV